MAKTSLIAGQSSGNLNFETAQKIIDRLLTQDRIKTDLDDGRIKGLGVCDNQPPVKLKAFTKTELAQKLGISVEELEKLKSPDFYETIVSKVPLPLIRLYCATKFADN